MYSIFFYEIRQRTLYSVDFNPGFTIYEMFVEKAISIYTCIPEIFIHIPMTVAIEGAPDPTILVV